MTIAVINIVKIFAPATIAFAIGMVMTPFWTDWLYRNKMWKKRSRTLAADGSAATILNQLHGDKKEVGTPRMGGVIVWGSVLLTTLFFALLGVLDGPLFDKLSFLSRNQTWLPLATLLGGALVGLVDDYFEITERFDYFVGGLSTKKRLGAVFLIGLIGALWFYFKLDVASIIVPFMGEVPIGILFIPFFILVMLATYSGGVIDGLDGLSGGVFSAIFSAYGTIAFLQNQIDLAAFCFVIVGGLLAFLWFNIPPARFYMTETGSMALTLALTVIAFLTKEVLVLPIIALPLVVSSLSSSLQLLSKRLRGGKKIFLVAPLHHHFEAIGWPAYKVVMRYWVISAICALVGVIIAIVG